MTLSPSLAVSPLGQRIWQNGLVLFVAGLAIGFVVKSLPNPRAALTAHLNAVQSGTFLIALGLLWPQLAVWPRAAASLANAIWISFWLLQIGLTLLAFAPAAPAVPSPGLKLAATLGQAAGGIVMFVALAALLVPFGRRG
jgi:hydroxylaminobenzene mutase